MKIHQLRSADLKNPPTAKRLIQKPTNCSVNRYQLVDFYERHFAVGGFFGKAHGS